MTSLSKQERLGTSALGQLGGAGHDSSVTAGVENAGQKVEEGDRAHSAGLSVLEEIRDVVRGRRATHGESRGDAGPPRCRGTSASVRGPRCDVLSGGHGRRETRELLRPRTCGRKGVVP